MLGGTAGIAKRKNAFTTRPNESCTKSAKIPLFASQLPAPQKGQTYQLWVNSGGRYVSLGTFNPPGSIDLGSFNVSALSKTVNATYTNTPFSFIVSSGGTAAQPILIARRRAIHAPAFSPAAWAEPFRGWSAQDDRTAPRG